MDEEVFEAHRERLRSVAFRLLGSLTEADDAVQETWLRVRDAERVESPRAFLTTVTARVCLNLLRSRRQRAEEPLDVRVPDPIVAPDAGGDPEHEAVLADAVGLALLVVLEALAPAERVAFVLHDLFAVPFDEIAPMLDRTPAATRLAGAAPGAGTAGGAGPGSGAAADGGRRVLRRRPEG